MIVIQIIIIIVALVIMFFVLGNRRAYAASAWKKIAICLLSLLMIIVVLFPDTISQIAHLVGVGRGADLLLYVLTLVFIGYVINDYIHRQHERDVIYRLTRHLAILEANRKYDIKSK
jgi:hypothetical protein